MKLNELFPDLIITEQITDDYILYKLKFNNEHPGAMIIKVKGIENYGEKYMPYPPGDVCIKFEASKDFVTVADSRSLKPLIEVFNQFIAKIYKASSMFANDDSHIDILGLQ